MKFSRYHHHHHHHVQNYDIVVSDDSHFHLLSLLICATHFLSFKLTVHKGQQSLLTKLEAMDQDPIDNDFTESGVNEDVPFKNTSNEGVKSNKCNQCNFVSFWEGNLRTHLKMRCGEKSN